MKKTSLLSLIFIIFLTTMLSAQTPIGDILVYSTQDGVGYDRTTFDENLPQTLNDFSVTITDRGTTPQITEQLLETYDELWVFSTDGISNGCFSTDELTTISNFRSSGKGIFIAADHDSEDAEYHHDANQISTLFGVTFGGVTDHGPDGSAIYPTFEQHELFQSVQSIVGHSSESIIIANEPVSVVSTYQNDNIIAILDDGLGRVVFDVSFTRMWDNGIEGENWNSVGDTPQYTRNIADWLMGNSTPTGHEYLPGDVNMALGIWPPTVIGGDVTYLVGYFIGGGQAACLLDGFWCSADINGDCLIIGGDVTALVAYFVAGGSITHCPDYEPAWLEGIPEEAPAGWPNCETPVINSRVIPTGQGK